MRAFTPRAASTVNIDVSSSSQSVKIADDGGDIDVRVFNNGTATVWIAFGTSAVSASLTANLAIPAGGVEVLHAPLQTGALYVAAIAAASTGKIYFTPGAGI